MKSFSQKFVLITVLLQLKISIQLVDAEFEFGDMLLFSQTGCGMIANHYAIYVDDENIVGKEKNDKLFHMIKSNDGSSGCTFTPMSKKGKYTVHNYLDMPKQSKAEMIKAIEELNGKCGKWSPTNTCEHIATSIRYGEAYAQCNQHGTLVGWVACPFLKFLTEPKASRSQRGAAEAA